MSGLFQVEPQYYSLGGTTEIDPTHIPEFPVSERLRGIEGRNIVGAPWDQLAAQADNARQAEERGGVQWYEQAANSCRSPSEIALSVTERHPSHRPAGLYIGVTLMGIAAPTVLAAASRLRNLPAKFIQVPAHGTTHGSADAAGVTRSRTVWCGASVSVPVAG